MTAPPSGPLASCFVEAFYFLFQGQDPCFCLVRGLNTNITILTSGSTHRFTSPLASRLSPLASLPTSSQPSSHRHRKANVWRGADRWMPGGTGQSVCLCTLPAPPAGLSKPGVWQMFLVHAAGKGLYVNFSSYDWFTRSQLRRYVCRVNTRLQFLTLLRNST